MASAVMANLRNFLALGPVSSSFRLQGGRRGMFSLSCRTKRASCKAADDISGRGQGLKIGRKVFLTGEQHYKRWMPTSEAERHLLGSFEESPSGEEEVDEEEVQDSHSQTGELATSLQPANGDEANSEEEEKEVQLSLEGADTSGGETSICKDLLIEFLKKRGALRGDNTRRSVGETSASLKSHSLEQINDSLSTEEIFGEKGLSTSAEHGEYIAPTGLIQEILNTVKSLPPNASLETFLTPFCGLISTYDGNLVLKALGENQLPWEMLSFFQWMRVHEPCLLDSRSFCTLFTYLGKLRMVDQALLQYDNMPEDETFHCVQVYNSLLGALSRSRRREDVPILLQEMERRYIERDSVTYSILITASEGVTDRYEKVWSLFDDLLSEGVRPSVSVYGSLIKAFCDEGQLKQALLVSLSMEKMGIFPNVVIYNTLIDAHARASLLEDAEGLLVEMKHKGLRPTESTYNALINGYGRNGQLDVAEELLWEMQQKEGLKPNVVTYTSLISAYAKHLSSEQAQNVFLRMRKSGLMPNTQTYTALINAYAEGGWHEKAQSAFDNMLSEGLKPTVETYTALLDGYRRAGDLEMVRRVWNTIKADGCELTKITYRTIMDAFAKYGQFVEARDVMDEFRKRGLEPDTMIFNMLVNAYARAGLFNKLRKVLWEMQAVGCEPDTFTYCTLIYSFIRIRDFTSAFKFDEEMLEKGLMPEPRMYGKMKFILDAKYKEKLENDKKANDGQPEDAKRQPQRKNPQRAKRMFKRYKKKGPRRGTERAKALWKEKEKQGLPGL
ncbi:unnamed protein product [Calypogeia fissa]